MRQPRCRAWGSRKLGTRRTGSLDHPIHTLPHPLHYSTLKHSMVSTTQHIPFLPHLNLYTTNVHVHYVYCTCNIYLSIMHSCYQSQMVVYFGHFGLIRYGIVLRPYFTYPSALSFAQPYCTCCTCCTCCTYCSYHNVLTPYKYNPNRESCINHNIPKVYSTF